MPTGILGGLLQGYAQGQQQKVQREREQEMMPLQKQMLQLKLQSEKLGMEELKTKQKLIDALMMKFQAGQQDKQAAQAKEQSQHWTDPVEQPTTPMAESMQAQGGGGLADAITAEELMALKMAGIDLTSAAGYGQRERHYDVIEEQGWGRLEQQKRGHDIREKTYERGFQEWSPLARTLPSGEQQTIMMPKFPGGQQGLGAQPPVISTSPGQKSLPIKEQDMPLWKHKETMEPPPFGMSPTEAQKQGYKRLTTSQVEMVQNFQQVENILGTIKGLMEKVFPEEEGPLQRMIGGPIRNLSALAQTNQDAALLMRLINGTLAPIVRSMGEKGNLSDTDIKRAGDLFPKLLDRGPVAWAMIKELESIIERNKQVKLGGAGLKPPEKSVSELSDEELLKQLGVK